MDNNEKFSLKDEISNSLLHGIGAGLSIAAIVLLAVFSAIYGNAWHIVSTAIYGATLFIMYLSSTLYHALKTGKAKNIFEIFDHASIYLLIAGTYTPYTLITLRERFGWIIFGIVWGAAIFGIVLKVFFVKKFVILSTLVYIFMGWIIVLDIKGVLLNLPTNGVTLLVIGGILYTLGTIFYIWRKLPFHHALWHIFVLAGSIFHFFSILLYVIPVRFN